MTKFMKDEMSFLFNHSNEQQLSRSLKAEAISIGCEAWIDVSRFSTREKSLQPLPGNPRVSRGHSSSLCDHNSLMKSFALLRKRLRRVVCRKHGLTRP